MLTEEQILNLVKTFDKNQQKLVMSTLYDNFEKMKPEIVRSIIPKICSTIDNQSVEVQSQVARVLGVILNFIGGNRYIKVLFKALIVYLTIDELDIRDKAITSFINLTKALEPEEIHLYAMPRVILAAYDSFYGVRVAAGVILSNIVYLLGSDDAENAKDLIYKLSRDRDMLVRKELAENFHLVVGSGRFDNKFYLDIIGYFANDISGLIQNVIPLSLAKLHKSNESQNVTLKICKTIFEQHKWQGELAVIEKLQDLQLSQENSMKFLLSAAEEQESVVRVAAAKQLIFALKNYRLSTGTLEKLFEIMLKDPCEKVRCEFAKSLSGTPDQYKDLLENTLSRLVIDDNVDVKVAAMCAVAHTGCAVSAAAEHLDSLFKSDNWRVRRDIVQILPQVARSLTEDQFHVGFLQILAQLFTDTACDVRHEASVAAKEVAKIYGETWLTINICPKIADMLKASSSVLRQSGVRAISVLDLDEYFSKELMNLTDDKVSNVRVTLAKEINKRQTRILDRLKSDPDPDVAHFAKKRYYEVECANLQGSF